MFGIGHQTTCVYKFITGDISPDYVLIIQYFIISGFGVCVITQTQTDYIFLCLDIQSKQTFTHFKSDR